MTEEDPAESSGSGVEPIPVPDRAAEPVGPRIRLPGEAVPVAPRSLVRRLLRLGLVLLALLGVLVASAPWLAGMIGRGELETILSEKLAATVRIDSARISWSGEVLLEGVVVEDPTQPGETILSVARLTGRPDLRAILRKEYRLGAVRMEGLFFHLVRLPDGSLNLDALGKASADPSPPPPFVFELEVAEGQLEWSDLKTGRSATMSDLALSATVDGLEEPFPMQLTGQFEERTIRASGRVRLFEGPSFVPWVDLNLDGEKGSLGDFASLLHQLGPEPVGFAGRVKWSGDRLSVVGGRLDVGDLDVRGDLLLDAGRLEVRGTVHYNWERLPSIARELLPAGMTLVGDGTEPFEIGGTLAEPDLRLELRATSLTYRELAFGALRASLHWRPQALVFESVDVASPSGGSLQVRARIGLGDESQHPWSVSVRFEEIALSHYYGSSMKFLGPIFYLTPQAEGTLSGKLDGTLELAADTFEEPGVLDSLRGRGQLSIEDGRIEGEGFFSQVADRFSNKKGFSFAKLEGDFEVADRWVETRRLELGGRGLTLRMKGRTSFDGKIDYDVKTDLLPMKKLGRWTRYFEGTELVPMRVVGTWSKPRVAVRIPGFGDLDPLHLFTDPLESLRNPLRLLPRPFRFLEGREEKNR